MPAAVTSRPRAPVSRNRPADPPRAEERPRAPARAADDFHAAPRALDNTPAREQLDVAMAQGARVQARRPVVTPSNAPARGDVPRLRLGDRNGDVKTLEQRLVDHGLLRGSADRVFDTRTMKAVMKLERRNGLKVNGVVGHRVWNLLGGAPRVGSGGSTTFRTVNINVRSNPEMPQDKVVHDVRRASRQGDIIGWQEIGPERYAQAIRDLGPEWGHYMPRDGKQRVPVPISWRKDTWEKTDEGFMRTHNGRAKVSPHRHVTWVELRNKETGEKIIRMNTHLVSGAWSRPRPTTEWRRDAWNTHMRKMDHLLGRLERRGHPVIIGGDFNRDSYKVLGQDVRHDSGLHTPTIGRSTLDYVMSTRDRDLRALGSRVDRGFASDHHAVVVRYRLGRDGR